MKWLAISALSLLAGCSQVPAPVVLARTQTLAGLGAGQGIAVANNHIYLFGDARPGILREYRLLADPYPSLRETGRSARLTVGGANTINHPTGLAVHPGLPTFLGNTITKTRQGRIYTLNLDQLLHDGWADRALLNETIDDLAVQGARPEYVRWHNRWVIATSDYGPGPNFIRLYDATVLASAQRTSDPGVLLVRYPCGPWVQSLHWCDAAGKLLIVQNVTEGRGWQLTTADLERGDCFGVARDFNHPTSELEGYAQIAGTLGIFITSSRDNNITFAVR